MWPAPAASKWPPTAAPTPSNTTTVRATRIVLLLMLIDIQRTALSLKTDIVTSGPYIGPIPNIHTCSKFFLGKLQKYCVKWLHHWLGFRSRAEDWM